MSACVVCGFCRDVFSNGPALAFIKPARVSFFLRKLFSHKSEIRNDGTEVQFHRTQQHRLPNSSKDFPWIVVTWDDGKSYIFLFDQKGGSLNLLNNCMNLKKKYTMKSVYFFYMDLFSVWRIQPWWVSLEHKFWNESMCVCLWACVSCALSPNEKAEEWIFALFEEIKFYGDHFNLTLGSRCWLGFTQNFGRRGGLTIAIFLGS